MLLLFRKMQAYLQYHLTDSRSAAQLRREDFGETYLADVTLM